MKGEINFKLVVKSEKKHVKALFIPRTVYIKFAKSR